MPAESGAAQSSSIGPDDAAAAPGKSINHELLIQRLDYATIVGSPFCPSLKITIRNKDKGCHSTHTNRAKTAAAGLFSIAIIII